jgi:small subunit ribosomal protein S17
MNGMASSMMRSSSSNMMQNVARRLFVLQEKFAARAFHCNSSNSSTGSMNLVHHHHHRQVPKNALSLPLQAALLHPPPRPTTITNHLHHYLVAHRSFSTNFEPQSSSSFQHDDDDGNNVDDDLSNMSNDELQETSTIPGWDLIHTPPRTFPRGSLVGTVVSDKMQKTVNVAVDRYRIVPKIRKRSRYTRKFLAHDETEIANVGDLVLIIPCHRISRHKHFMLKEIIRPKRQL